jgi:class 3 adenylate cyclase
MKRKIAAIVAADIAGYSKLVAEDEEETLRRLASYRSVFDDFITRFSGRIFNTAGDAVLAEFPSSVEAVRCAIDVQESIRTRNLAYPQSRQMSFRIGITIGDVVERDGDLLGDGVNIAARLEGLAQPGGVCVSRAVYEQVANKLSVAFVDIGEQAVKNIPTPIHAYTVALNADDPRQQRVALPLKRKKASAVWPVAITAASIAALASIGLAYQLLARTSVSPAASTTPQAETVVAPAPSEQARPAQKQADASPLQPTPLATDRQRTDNPVGGSNASSASNAGSSTEHKAPCVEIRTACAQAGFLQGGMRDGSGIFYDCIRPIMLGTPQPRTASRPLPQIDPQVVNACKDRNPRFGESLLDRMAGSGRWRMQNRP